MACVDEELRKDSALEKEINEKTSQMLRSNTKNVIGQESLCQLKDGKGKMKAMWRKGETCGCAESSWEPPCSGRLIEALGGSRL